MLLNASLYTTLSVLLLSLLDWQTHNNAIFGTKSFLNTFPIVLISAINHLAV